MFEHFNLKCFSKEIKLVTIIWAIFAALTFHPLESMWNSTIQFNAYNVCEVIRLDLFNARPPKNLLIDGDGDADECYRCPNRFVINSVSFILYYQNRPSHLRKMHKSCLTERRQPKVIKSKWCFCVVICEPHESHSNLGMQKQLYICTTSLNVAFPWHDCHLILIVFLDISDANKCFFRIDYKRSLY